jgi:hypothetical protein
MGAADEDAPAFAFAFALALALAALLLDPLDLRFLDVFLEPVLPFLSLEDFPLSSNELVFIVPDPLLEDELLAPIIGKCSDDGGIGCECPCGLGCNP